MNILKNKTLLSVELAVFVTPVTLTYILLMPITIPYVIGFPFFLFTKYENFGFMSFAFPIFGGGFAILSSWAAGFKLFYSSESILESWQVVGLSAGILISFCAIGWSLYGVAKLTEFWDMFLAVWVFLMPSIFAIHTLTYNRLSAKKNNRTNTGIQ